ncbi:MAG: ATP-binding protein [Nanoarchaeota archaeon]
MDTARIKALVAEQRESLGKKELGIEREALSLLDRKIQGKSILAITGSRRVGKSTLLLQIMKKYFNGNFHYFNFEDERLASFTADDFNVLLEAFIELYGLHKTMFFDEIQNIFGWEKFVRRLHDSGYKVIITGSNATLLSSELATHLTGRHVDVVLYPFSFSEFLRLRGIIVEGKMLLMTEERAKIMRHFAQYLEYGGYPEFLQMKDTEILLRIYQDIIQKDVILRYNISEKAKLKELADYLISNMCGKYTYNRLKNDFGLGSTHTVQNFISYLSNTYLLFELAFFSYKFRERMKMPKKIYCMDNGMYRLVSTSFSANRGKYYENLVFLYLKKRFGEVYYWKDERSEVDFIIKQGAKVVGAYQVCFDFSNKEVKEREVKGLIAALKAFTLNSGILITAAYEAEETVGRKKIKYVPLWKWVLSA